MPEVARVWVTVGADTRQAEEGIRRAEGALRAFAASVRRIGEQAASFALAQIGVASLNQALGTAAELTIGFNARLEQSARAFRVMLGSAEQANAFLQEMAAFAAKTPFRFEDVQEGARRLMAMGFSAREVLPMLTAIGNAAAAMGLGAEGIDRLILALGQMRARTKVSAEEMRQLVQAGIPAWDILAQAIGKSVAETMKLAEEGQISSEVFIDAFRRFTEARFGDMMEEQSKTFLGALSTIQDNITLLASTAFRPLFDALSQAAVAFAEFTQSGDFENWAVRAQATVAAVIEAVKELAPAFYAALSAVAETVFTLGSIILQALGLIDPTQPHSPPLTESIRRGVDEILASFSDLRAVEAPLRAAADAVDALEASAASGLGRMAAEAEAARDRMLASLGRDVPAAFRAAEAAVAALEAQASGLEAAIRAQEAAIASLERAMRDNSRAMQESQERASALRDAIRQAQDEIRRLAGAPLAGTKEFRDRLFQIEQQANAVRLQLLKMEAAGATKVEMEPLRKQLEDLERQAEMVRLEERLKFDPLRKQIDELASDSKELTFEEIVRGITEQKNRIAELTPQLEAEEARYRSLAEAQKALQASMEAERDRLAAMRDAHAALTEQIRAMRDAMDAVARAAREKDAAMRRAKDSAAALGGAVAAAKQKMGPDEIRELMRAQQAQQRQMEGLKEEILSRWQPALANARKTMEDFAATMRDVNEQLKAFAPSVRPIAASLGMSTGQFLAFAAVVGGAAIALDIVGGAIAKVIAFFSGFIGIIRAAIPIVAAVAGVIGQVVTALAAILGVSTAVAGAILAIIAVLAALGVAYATNLGGFRDTVNRVFADVWQTISSTAESVRIAIGSALSWIASQWSFYWNQVLFTLRGIWDQIRFAISSGLGFIQSAIAGARDGIIGAWASLWNGLRDTASAVAGGIVGTIKSVINTFIGGINRIIQAWNRLEFRIPAATIWIPGVGWVKLFEGFTIGTIKLPEVPYLAEGGIVRRPTLAVIGEAGPEAVVPLRRSAPMGGITVNVTVQGSVIAQQDLAAAIRNELLHLGRRLGQSNPLWQLHSVST